VTVCGVAVVDLEAERVRGGVDLERDVELDLERLEERL
jgi:hypothetical protein